MRAAALVFGLLAGLLGSGIIALGNLAGGLAEAGLLGNHDEVVARFVLYVAPNIGLLGAGMALARPRLGGLLLLASAAAWVGIALLAGHGAVLFAALPFTFAGAGGLVALFAGRPPAPEAVPATPLPAPLATSQPPRVGTASPRRLAASSSRRSEPAFDFAPAAAAPAAAWDEAPHASTGESQVEDYVDADEIVEAEAAADDGYPYEEEPGPAEEPDYAPADYPAEAHDEDAGFDPRDNAYDPPEDFVAGYEVGTPHAPDDDPDDDTQDADGWAEPEPEAPPAAAYAAERQASGGSRRQALRPDPPISGRRSARMAGAAGPASRRHRAPPAREEEYRDVEPYEPPEADEQPRRSPLGGFLRILITGVFVLVVVGIAGAVYVDFQRGTQSLLFGSRPQPAGARPAPASAAAVASPPATAAPPVAPAPDAANTIHLAPAVPAPPTLADTPAAGAAQLPDAVPSTATPVPAAETIAALPAPGFADPFGYCEAVDTIDAPDDRFTGPPAPPAVVAALQLPAPTPPGQVHWRCANRTVMACNADHAAACDLTPTVDTMLAYCAQHPDAQAIPAPNGSWSCSGARPVIPRDQKWPVDARGFYPGAWIRVAPPGT